MDILYKSKQTENNDVIEKEIDIKHKNTLELLSIIYVDAKMFKACNGERIEDNDNKKARFNTQNGILSPFKSPITSKVVNLRANRSSFDLSIYNQVNRFSDVFEDSGSCESADYKHKRKSSIIAEEKIKKIIEKDSMLMEESDMFVQSEFDSMFCGISKNRKLNIPEDAKSFISDILRDVNSNQNAKVLQDKTNSPIKNEFSIKKLETTLNTRFFLDDSSVVETALVTEKEEQLDYGCSKNYIKLKEANTKFNEGYKIVEIRKKVVIDLFSCPKSFYRKSERPRKVYFDIDAACSRHNTSDEIRPIMVESDVKSDFNFEWNGEKEVVDVVKRIDLGSEASVDDFVFNRIDRSIQS